MYSKNTTKYRNLLTACRTQLGQSWSRLQDLGLPEPEPSIKRRQHWVPTVLRVKIFKEISLGLILTRGLFTLEKMAYPRVKIVSPRLISLKISPLGYWYQPTSTGTIFFLQPVFITGKIKQTILEINYKNYLDLDFLKQNDLNSAQVPDQINIRSWIRICIKLFWSHNTRWRIWGKWQQLLIKDLNKNEKVHRTVLASLQWIQRIKNQCSSPVPRLWTKTREAKPHILILDMDTSN